SNSTKLKKMLEGLSRYFLLLYDTQPNFIQISLKNLMHQAFENVQKNYPQAESSLNIQSGLPEISADPLLIRELLELIFDNAHKFQPKTGKIRVKVNFAGEGSQIILKIRDNGVGFDSSYAHRIFRLFGRLHKDSEYPGEGIGMTLASAIVFIHQGQIWAESPLNEETCFFIRLPRSQC
ncbi:MAG: ATP-binding protein, partial [Bacteroidota bacterium]